MYLTELSVSLGISSRKLSKEDFFKFVTTFGVVKGVGSSAGMLEVSTFFVSLKAGWAVSVFLMSSSYLLGTKVNPKASFGFFEIVFWLLIY